MSVVIEQTPNPNALKFLVSREVVGSKTPKFYKKDSVDSLTEDVPLVNSLFQFNGVIDVFFGSNFITVGKNDTVDWGEIRSEIMEVIRDYNNSNHPYVIDDFPKPACEKLNSDVTQSKIEKNKPIIITEIWNNNKRKEENLSTSREDVFELLYSYGYVYESFGKARKNDFCFLPKEV